MTRLKERQFSKGLVEKIIAGLLIVLLTYILVTGAAALWGKVFSADCDGSWINGIYQWLLHRWPFCVPLTLRESDTESWNALSGAIRVSDGTLAPVQWALNLIGVGSIALAAYNEYSAKRVQGILLGDALRYLFPFHRLILRVFHIAFFALGNYACLKDAGMAGVMSLAGLLVCTVYSLPVLALLSTPLSGSRWWIHIYIRAILRRSATGEGADPAREYEARQCVMDYASYIGELWNRPGYQPKWKFNKSEEFWLLRIAIAWVQKCEVGNVKARQPAQEDLPPCRAAFWTFFMDGEASGIVDPPPVAQDAEHVLFTRCLPCRLGRDCGAFRVQLLQCKAIWGNLLGAVETPRRQKQMVYKILSSAYRFSPACFALMAGGLLLQSGTLCVETPEEEKKSVTTVPKFLWDLYLLEKENEAAHTQTGAGFSSGWDELAYISVLSLLWSCSMRLNSNGDVTGVRSYWKDAVRANVFDRVCRELGGGKELYAACGFVLFCTANHQEAEDLSVVQMIHCYDFVMKELESFDS